MKKDIVKKINFLKARRHPQTVEQLARALPDSELLKKVNSAYKSAKASGLYV